MDAVSFIYNGNLLWYILLYLVCICQEFILGECQKLHIHIQRIPIEYIPKDADDFKQWLSDQFVEKEK